ncbi:MAG TPA: hypothetical protein VGA60_13890 [Kiloniellales bacterium]
MSMTNVESWSVDLSTIGPIYPMVGTEGLLVLLGVVFWIGWHIWQIRFESRLYDEDVKLLKEPGKLEEAMRKHVL